MRLSSGAREPDKGVAILVFGFSGSPSPALGTSSMAERDCDSEAKAECGTRMKLDALSVGVEHHN